MALFNGVVHGKKPSIKGMYGVLAAACGALLVRARKELGRKS
jgi:hypothetical protein